MELNYIARVGLSQSFIVLLLFQFGPIVSVGGDGTSPIVPAVVVFGDSIVDTGNNNNLMSIAKSNFPPYGLDFVGHKPTGRFSNGKVPSDFLASKLGLKEYLPAYLDPNLGPDDILTGVTFGSGASGYDPLTSKLVGAVSMRQQLEYFKEYKEKVLNIAGEEKGATIIDEALYVLCCGTNDIANTYFTTPFRRAEYDVPSYVDLLVDCATSFVEELVSLGAKKIGFLGLPPIGCLPSQRTLGGGIAKDCDPERNEAAMMYNSKMMKILPQLANKYQGTKIVFLDIYSILSNIIQSPTNYGFVEVSRGCCGTGTIEVSILCNKFTPITCPDDTEFLFFDGFHPTERGYDILMSELLSRYLKYI